MINKIKKLSKIVVSIFLLINLPIVTVVIFKIALEIIRNPTIIF